MAEQWTTPLWRRLHASTFSDSEWRALRVLRDHYRQNRDLFSARELGHLRFVRWLYYTGRVVR